MKKAGTALNDRQQLVERSNLIKHFSSRPGYFKKVTSALHRGSLKPRKGYWSKLLGSIKTQISNNIL